MAGPSKWSIVKRITGAIDVIAGRLFSRLSDEITVANRMAAAFPPGNPRLRALMPARRAYALRAMPNPSKKLT